MHDSIELSLRYDTRQIVCVWCMVSGVRAYFETKMEFQANNKQQQATWKPQINYKYTFLCIEIVISNDSTCNNLPVKLFPPENSTCREFVNTNRFQQYDLESLQSAPHRSFANRSIQPSNQPTTKTTVRMPNRIATTTTAEKSKTQITQT